MPNANAENVMTPPSLGTRALRAGLVAAVLLGAVALLAWAQMPCAFARLTHVPCPGCGSTRAMLALASGDFASVVRMNPLAPLMTLLAVILGGQALWLAFRTGSLRGLGKGKLGTIVSWVGLVVAILELAVWIARFAGALGGPVPI